MLSESKLFLPYTIPISMSLFITKFIMSIYFIYTKLKTTTDISRYLFLNIIILSLVDFKKAVFLIMYILSAYLFFLGRMQY